MKKILNFITLAAALLYAAGCENKNETAPVTPPEEDKAECISEGPFSIEIYDLHSSSCKIKVTPENETDGYYCGVATDTYLASFGSLDDLTQTVLAYIQNYISELDGVEFSGALKSGVHEREISGLVPEQTIIVFACHVDEEGNILSDIHAVKETTPPLESSKMTFDIEVDMISATGAYLFITPTTDDPYVWMELPQDLYQGKSMEEIEAFLLKYYQPFFASRTKTGEMAYNFDGTLVPDTEYMIFVFGYDGGITTPIFTETFRTDKPGDASKTTFSFEYVNMTSYGVDVNITPSDASVLYLCIVAAESYFNGEPSEQDVLDLLNKEINAAIRFGECEDRADFAESYAHRGPKGISFALSPGAVHYTCAVTLTEDGEFASGVTIDTFTAPQEQQTDASVTIAFEEYFDGNEIASAYPSLEEYAGSAVLPVRFTLNETATAAIYTVFPASLIEEEGASDEEIRAILIDQINIVEGNTFFTSDRVDLQLDWDTDYILYVVAFDENETAGNLKRAGISALSKSAASPASGYQPLSDL